MSQVKQRNKKILLAPLAALFYIYTLKIMVPPILRRFLITTNYDCTMKLWTHDQLSLATCQVWLGLSGFLVAPSRPLTMQSQECV